MTQSQLTQPQGLRHRLMQRLGPWGFFFKGFIKNPTMVGSIIPSSDTLVRRVLEPVDWKHVRLFVEYGPGVGTFTRPLLNRLSGDATLIVIDTNPDFIGYLQRTIRDRRLIAVLGSAADVESIIAEHGFDHADYILSGLPFSTLPPGVGEAIAAATFRALRPGGQFLVYQFRARARDFLAPWAATIASAYEWVNIPPCFIFWAMKGDADPQPAAPPSSSSSSPS